MHRQNLTLLARKCIQRRRLKNLGILFLPYYFARKNQNKVQPSYKHIDKYIYQTVIKWLIIKEKWWRGINREENTDLQFSIGLGRDSRRFPETLRILSFDKHPIEFGRDFSWFECTSNTTTFSNLAVKDSGMFWKFKPKIYICIYIYIRPNRLWN